MNTPMWIAACTAIASIAASLAWTKAAKIETDRGYRLAKDCFDLGRAVGQQESQAGGVLFARLCMGMLDVSDETQMEVMRAAVMAIQEQAEEEALSGTAEDLERLYQK